jgi:hypothetical protein
LKELDEATFFKVFDGVPQAISRSEVEAGVDIVILLKTGFQIKRRSQTCAYRIQFQLIKKSEDFVPAKD